MTDTFNSYILQAWCDSLTCRLKENYPSSRITSTRSSSVHKRHMISSCVETTVAGIYAYAEINLYHKKDIPLITHTHTRMKKMSLHRSPLLPDRLCERPVPQLSASRSTFFQTVEKITLIKIQ